MLRRSPHGECGLKSGSERNFVCEIRSLPAWGVWIEIKIFHRNLKSSRSLPAWGVWIEIPDGQPFPGGDTVAPRMGSVD